MPPSAAPTLTRRALAAVALVGGLVLGSGAAAWAQEPVPTTTPTATSGVLVPGTTAPPSSTTATTQAPPADESDDEGGGFLDLDANEKVWVIVGALVAIAILMMVLTVIYWRHTKPDRAPKQDRRIEKSERREAKAERKDEKRQHKAARKDPFGGAAVVGDADDEDDDEPAPRPSDGPMDLDAILGSPHPSRSVFGADEEDDPSR